MISLILMKSLIVGFHFSKFGGCNPTTFPEKLHHSFLRRSFANFFGIDKKSQSWLIAQNILSREVKWILQRGGWTGAELQKKIKWAIRKTPL